MKGAGAAPRNQREAVAMCLAVAAVERVSSIVPIFFGRLASLLNTDQVQITQGVQLVWRELGGLSRENALRRVIRTQLPEFRSRAIESQVRGAVAVVSALDAISVLIEKVGDSQDHLRRSLAAALGVAVDFDSLTAQPPSPHLSWTAYELRGQAELFDLLPMTATTVSSELLFDLQMKSGQESMNYRNAMRSLLDAARTRPSDP